MSSAKPVLSVVVPVYNEAAGLPHFHAALSATLANTDGPHEIVFVNDGSTDDSAQALASIAKADNTVRVLSFTRNFGKEIATTAGLHQARGQAIITLDADGQHPIDAIPEFVERWRGGAKVIVGRRIGARRASLGKRLGYKLFYGLFRRLTGIRVEPDMSDYRLIDHEVQAQFNRMTEHRRFTRALVDWLGYPRVYVAYTENPRLHGSATYSFGKLCKLAIDSAISLSISPLYITAYIGAFVLPLSALLGLAMIINYLLGDPLHVHATGGAYLTVLMLFLVGILLVSQGIIGLYLSHIHTETQGRPLYVVDKTRSKGLT